MRELAGRTLSAHALTHAHPDHQGSSHAICERLQIPLWCGQGDVPAMETPGGIANSQAPGWLNRLQQRFWTGPPHPVARALVEGDEVAGFTVLETPGHSRGHVAYWRESDGVLILGDVLNNINVRTGHPRPARAAGDVHARPGAQPRVGAPAGRAAPAADAASATARRCATPAGSRDFVARLPELRRLMSESVFIARRRAASCRPSRRAGRGIRRRCTAARPRR